MRLPVLITLPLLLAIANASAADCPAPADGKPHGNRLRWTTASEQDSFGFEVFRAGSENGELARITKNPVLAAGTTDETHHYEYRDETIDPQRDYWYSVDLVHTDNSRERIISAWKAPAKCAAK